MFVSDVILRSTRFASKDGVEGTVFVFIFVFHSLRPVSPVRVLQSCFPLLCSMMTRPIRPTLPDPTRALLLLLRLLFEARSIFVFGHPVVRTSCVLLALSDVCCVVLSVFPAC